MPNAEPDCLFCKIAAGEIPAQIVARTDRVLAFRDVDPKAPTHVLTIPIEHYANAAQTAAADPHLLAEVVAIATQVAADEGLDGGYRLVTNTGDDAGQSVQHFHLHLLGGRSLTWPPG